MPLLVCVPQKCKISLLYDSYELIEAKMESRPSFYWRPSSLFFSLKETAGMLLFSFSPDVRHNNCKTLQSNINAESHYQWVRTTQDSLTVLPSSHHWYQCKSLTSQRRTDDVIYLRVESGIQDDEEVKLFDINGFPLLYCRHHIAYMFSCLHWWHRSVRCFNLADEGRSRSVSVAMAAYGGWRF